MAVGRVTYGFQDYSGEIGRVQLNIAELNAGNIAAQLAAMEKAAGALGSKLCALSNCGCKTLEVVASKSDYGAQTVTDQYAQRELGLMVTYQDNVNGKTYRVTIPGPDWATIGQAGSDLVNTAAQAWIDFKSAMETYVKSELGNAITVTAGRLVGRNK